MCLHVVPSCLPGMRDRELYSALNTCNELSSRDEPMTWQELLQLSRKPKDCVPMTTFTYVVLSLQRYEFHKSLFVCILL